MQEIRLTDPRAIKAVEAFAAKFGISDPASATAILIMLANGPAADFNESWTNRLTERLDFPTALREARSLCGLSQRALAMKVGISNTTVFDLEKGTLGRRHHDSTVFRVARALQPYTDELIAIHNQHRRRSA